MRPEEPPSAPPTTMNTAPKLARRTAVLSPFFISHLVRARPGSSDTSTIRPQRAFPIALLEEHEKCEPGGYHRRRAHPGSAHVLVQQQPPAQRAQHDRRLPQRGDVTDRREPSRG